MCVWVRGRVLMGEWPGGTVVLVRPCGSRGAWGRALRGFVWKRAEERESKEKKKERGQERGEEEEDERREVGRW